MAKKKTMKRKMKKRGTRRCWGGVGTRTSKKTTEKGEAYKASIDAKTISKIQNKELKSKVDDLTEAFGSASISSTPK